MDRRMLTKISEQFTILPKSKIKAGQGLEHGKYPFYTSSDTKISYLDTYEYDDEIVILGTGGKPSCNYAKGKFSFSTDNFALKTKGNIKPKYLFYFLRNNNLSILENGFHGAGLKHIGKEYLLNIFLPLENKEKQEKIIKILDFITEAKENTINRMMQLDELVKSRFICQEVTCRM